MGIGGPFRVAVQRLGILTVMVALITGCGGGGAAEPTPTPKPAPTSTPVPITMSGVTWTTAIDPATHEPLDRVERFPNDAAAIIAAVEIQDVPPGAVLTATWAIDGEPVPEATMTATTETSLASGWATFQFTREDGHLFPLGELSVTVTSSDGATVSGNVQIVVPAE